MASALTVGDPFSYWTPRAVRSFRDFFGVDRARFARLVGADPRSVSRWEAGHARPQGAPAEIMSALREVLLEEDDEKKRARVVAFVLEASDVGGIGYLLVKLLKERVK